MPDARSANVASGRFFYVGPCAAGLLALFAILACVGDEPDRTANARQEAAPPDESPQIGGEGWHLVEDLRIDGNEELFSLPSGFLVVQKDGGMVFADRVAYQLRAYDAAGRHRFDFGRRGDGPGEFRSRARIASLSGGLVGDTVWVYDPAGRRFTYLDGEGRLIGTASGPQLPDVRIADTGRALPAVFEPLAVYGDGRMIGKRVVTVSRDTRDYRVDLVMLEAGSATVRTLATQNPPRMETLVDQRTGGTYSFPVGGTPMIVGAAQDGSRIALVHRIDSAPGIWSLVVLDSRGDTIVTRSVPVDTVPVGEDAAERPPPPHIEELQNDLRGHNVGGRTVYTSAFIDRVGQALREQARARSGVSVTRVHVGLDGAIWLAFASPPDHSKPFLMLEPNGDVIGKVVAAPSGAGYAPYSGAVSRQHLWALVGDTDGVPSIVRYRVVGR